MYILARSRISGGAVGQQLLEGRQGLVVLALLQQLHGRLVMLKGRVRSQVAGWFRRYSSSFLAARSRGSRILHHGFTGNGNLNLQAAILIVYSAAACV